MEARNITIVTTQNQNKYVVNTDATTLRELKSALAAHDISYEGMTFYEGLSHTELLTDDSVLPHDVPYKGNITNELVFMLTTPNKKIKSGAVLPETRQALYDTLEEMGLKDEVANRYGKNFTQCKNSELMAVIEDAQKSVFTEEDSTKAALRLLIDILEDDAILFEEDVNKLRNILDGVPAEDTGNKSPYSEDDINTMFEFLD